MLTTFILTVVLIGSFFLLMSIRLILIKNGEFKGTCASQNPEIMKEGGVCSYCGKEPQQCKNQQ